MADLADRENKAMKELNANKDWLDVVSYEILGELPNPFVFNNGTPIKDATDWMKRRKEISKKVIDLQFGAMPPAPEIFTVEKLNQGKTHSSPNTTPRLRRTPLSPISAPTPSKASRPGRY